MAVGAAAAGAWVAANAGAIAAVTAAAGAVYQGMAARAQAEKQEKYQKQQNEMAVKSMTDQYSQLTQAEADSQERALQESQENQRQYARRRSQINLMAAASGTNGLSVHSMMVDLNMEKGRNLNTILKNQEIEMQGFRNQAEAIRTGTAARIDNREIQRPSWAEIGLNAGSAAAGGYMTGTDLAESAGLTGDPSATLSRGNPTSFYDSATGSPIVRGGV